MLLTPLALADEQSRSERSDFVQRWTLLVRSLRVWGPTLAVVSMLGVCPRLTEAMPDRQDRSRIHHEMVELVTERAFAMTCDYNAAALDRTHDLHLLQADMAAVGFTPSGAMGVKTAKAPRFLPKGCLTKRLQHLKPPRQAAASKSTTFCIAASARW
jgi:hypothetical protein